MIFTKQDIETIHRMLTRISIKDSQFDTVSTLSDNTFVPVVVNNKNKRIGINDLVTQITNSLDYSMIPVDITGFDKKTLDSALESFYNAILDIDPNAFNGAKITAAGVGYTADLSIDTVTALGIASETLKDVKTALDAIIFTILAIKAATEHAKDGDINGLFTNLTNE